MSGSELDELLETSTRLCPTPIELGFYQRVAETFPATPTIDSHRLDDLNGYSFEVSAGAGFSIELLEGPQIVNLFVFNPHDPDERMWQQQTTLKEGLFFQRFSRVWGTMARHRPLLTMIENTVSQDVRMPTARHHPYFGGSGTPVDWKAAGGPPGVKSTWEQLASLLEARKTPLHILGDNLCLFQRSIVDPGPKTVEILPSNAIKGDRVSFFAEIDLCVLVALSPFVGGDRPAATPGLPVPHAVEISLAGQVADPLPWPYPSVRYPDLSPYLDESGRRSTEVSITPGIDYDLH